MSDTKWNQRDFVLDQVKRDGKYFYYASESLKDDENIVFQAYKISTRSFKFASSRIKSNRNFILKALKVDAECVGYAGKSILNDLEIMKEVIKQNDWLIEEAGEKIKSSFEIAEMICVDDFSNIIHFSKKIQRNTRFIIDLINKQPYKPSGFIASLPNLEFTNRELLLTFLKKFNYNGEEESVLKNIAGHELTDDEEVAKAAVISNPYEYLYLSDRLKSNREIATSAVFKNLKIYSFLPNELKEDKDIIKKILGQDGRFYRELPSKFKDDFELALIAAKSWNYLLEFDDLKPEFKTREEMMLLRVKIGDIKFQRLRKDLKQKKEFFIAGIYQLANEKYHSSYDLKEIFDSAHSGFSSDRSLMIEACKVLNLCYKFIDTSLKKDAEIINVLFEKDVEAFEYINKEFRSSKDLLLKILVNTKNVENKFEDKNFHENFEKHIPLDVFDDEKLVYQLLSYKKSELLRVLPKSYKSDLTFINNANQVLEKREPTKNPWRTEYHYDKASLYRFASDDIKGIKSVAKAILNNSNSDADEIMGMAPKHIRSDKEIVDLALENHVRAFQHIDLVFRGNEEYIKKVLDQEIEMLEFVDKKIKYNHDFIMSLLESKKLNYRLFDRIYGNHFKNDESFVIKMAEIEPIIILKYDVTASKPFSLIETFGLELSKSIIELKKYWLNEKLLLKYRLMHEVFKNLTFEAIDTSNWENDIEALRYFLLNVQENPKLAIPLKKSIFEWAIDNKKNEIITTFIERKLLSENIITQYAESLAELNQPTINSRLLESKTVVDKLSYSFNEKDRKKILNDLTEKGKLTKKFKDLVEKHYLNDYDIVYELVGLDSTIYPKIDETLKADFNTAKRAIDTNPLNYKEAPDSIKSIKEISLSVIEQQPSLYYDMPDDQKSDQEIALLALIQDINMFSYEYSKSFHKYYSHRRMPEFFPKSLLQDKEFAKKAIKVYPHYFFHIDHDLQKDEEIIMEAIKCDGTIITKLEKSHLSSKKLVLEAIKNSPPIYKSLNTELKKDKDVILAAIQASPKTIDFIPKTLDADEAFYDDLVSEMIKQKTDISKLKNAKNDLNIVKAILRSDKYYFKLDFDNAILNHPEVKAMMNQDFITTKDYGKIKLTSLWNKITERLDLSGFSVDIKFPNNRKYYYNSSFYLLPGDYVTVTGKMTDTGVVQSISLGITSGDHVQRVSKIIYSKAKLNYTVNMFISYLRKDKLMLLEMLANMDYIDSPYSNNTKQILADLNYDLDFWKAAVNGTPLQKEYLKKIIQKYPWFFDIQFEHKSLISDL